MPLRKPKKPQNLGQAMHTGQSSSVPSQASMGPKPPMAPATAPVGQNPAAVTPPPKAPGARPLPPTAPATNTSPPPMVGTPALPPPPAGAPPAADIAAGVGGPTLDEAGYPLTPESAAARAGADEAWGNAQSEFGNSVYRAALQYGDPNVLAQYSQYGPVVENPNGDLATIDRVAGEQRVNTNNSLNNQNLFFSGVNQKAQGAIDTGVSRDRAAAWQRFVDARDRLSAILARAKGAHADVYRTTGAADINADLAKPPEPTGPAAGDEPVGSVGPGPEGGVIHPGTPPKKSVRKKPPRATGGQAQPRSGSKKKSPRRKN